MMWNLRYGLTYMIRISFRELSAHVDSLTYRASLADSPSSSDSGWIVKPMDVLINGKMIIQSDGAWCEYLDYRLCQTDYAEFWW